MDLPGPLPYSRHKVMLPRLRAGTEAAGRWKRRGESSCRGPGRSVMLLVLDFGVPKLSAVVMIMDAFSKGTDLHVTERFSTKDLGKQ